MNTSWVYILKCSDDSYYTGCTSELSQRVAQHQDGTFEGYTSSRRPVTLVFSQELTDINDAIQAERQIKGWSRKKKEALIKGDFNLLHELAECKNQTHYSKQRHGERSRTMTIQPRHPSTKSTQSVAEGLRVTPEFERLNKLELEKLEGEFTRCCGSSRWVQQMLARRPFESNDELFRAANEIWWSLSESDWKEAFSHHPKIGDIESLRKKFAGTANWASNEQAGTSSASEETLEHLAEGNRLYEERFGYIFIVCATGKSADEMLATLKSRLPNSPDDEIEIAAVEHAKISRLRLEKLLKAPARVTVNRHTEQKKPDESGLNPEP